jgi:hypothetical protein
LTADIWHSLIPLWQLPESLLAENLPEFFFSLRKRFICRLLWQMERISVMILAAEGDVANAHGVARRLRDKISE